MVTSNDIRIGAIHKATVPRPPPGTGIPQAMPTPPGTGIPQAMPTPPGTGIPQAIPQGGPSMPSMAQGGLSTMPQGDPRMLPFSDLASVSLNEDKDNAIFRAIKRLDQAGEKRSKEKENAKKENMVKMLAGIFESARRTGVRIPENMSPESGGLPTMSAAGGGRVVYRRESGVVDPEQTTAERNAIIQQIRDLAQNYGVATNYWDMTQPLSPENNPAYFAPSGDDPALAGMSMGQLVNYQYPGSGVPQNQIGGTTYGVPQGYGGFRAEHERLLGQLKEEPVGIRDFQPLGSVSDLSDTNISGSPQLPSSPPTDPTSLPTPADIQIYNEDRYGGLEDPNLPPLDAAQLRNLYRQQVGYFDTPPGPTDNTRRLLDQAYGRGTPVYDEVLAGLQPRPIANTEQAARRAFDNLPDDVKIVTEDTVTAAGGGGLLPLVRRLSMGPVRPNASEQELAERKRVQDWWERYTSDASRPDYSGGGGGPQVKPVPPPPVAPPVTGDPNYQPITSNTQLPTGLDEYGNQLRAREAGVYYSPTEKTQTADVFRPPPTSTPGTSPVSPPPVYPDGTIDELFEEDYPDMNPGVRGRGGEDIAAVLARLPDNLPDDVRDQIIEEHESDYRRQRTNADIAQKINEGFSGEKTSGGWGGYTPEYIDHAKTKGFELGREFTPQDHPGYFRPTGSPTDWQTLSKYISTGPPQRPWQPGDPPAPVMGQPAFRDATPADMQANPGGFGNMMQQLIPGWNATNAQNQLQNQYQPYQPQAQQAAGGFGGANLYGQTTGNAFGNQFGANPYAGTGGPMAPNMATGFGAANPYGQTGGNVFAAQGGGLYELAAGGEFSGRVPGDGGGMQDNVRMPIKEGANQVATLAVSPTEYVVDSHTMAALGNGNPDKGADHMDNVIKGIRRQAYGNDKQPNQIDGLRSLRSMMG